MSSLGTSTATDAENDVSKLLSDWIASNEAASLGAVDSANDPSWVLAYLPPVESLSFNPTHRTLRALFMFVFLAVVAIGILAGIGIFAAISAVIVDVLLITLFLVVSGFLFLRTAEAQAKRDSLKRFKQGQGEINKAKQSASKAEKFRRSLCQNEKRSIGKLAKRLKDTHESEQKELRALDARLAAHLTKLGVQTQTLLSEESAEIDIGLRSLQNLHLMAQLSTAYIQAATIQGFGETLKYSLQANGINTAADFTGISYGADSKVLINLRNGSKVRILGIGEVKAVALDTWRRNIEVRARGTQPLSLPPAQVQVIRIKYAQKRQLIAQEEINARADAVAKQRHIRERFATIRTTIATELTETRDRFSQEYAQSDQHLSEARREERDVTWLQESTQRDLSKYTKVTYWKYCVSVARG